MLMYMVFPIDIHACTLIIKKKQFLRGHIVCRLKAVDSVLSGVESMKQVVADFEIALVSQDTMTSDPSSLYQLREELQVTRRL